MATKYFPCAAGSLGKDIPANYEINVNGKKILTSGTVQSVRRVGLLAIEITLKHRKTGEIHKNVLDARQEVYVFAAFLQDGYADEMLEGGELAAMCHMEGTDARELAQMWVDSSTEKLVSRLRNNTHLFFNRPIEA